MKTFLDEHECEREEEGRRAVVRNGYQPEREVLTGIGPVRVQVPKTRDRRREGRCFRSELLPPYLKKPGEFENPVGRLVTTPLTVGDDMAPVETIKALRHFLRAESAQMLWNRLPYESSLLHAPADASSAGVQVSARVDGAPIQVLGEASQSFVSNTESGRDARRARTNEVADLIGSDGLGVSEILGSTVSPGTGGDGSSARCCLKGRPYCGRSLAQAITCDPPKGLTSIPQLQIALQFFDGVLNNLHRPDVVCTPQS